MCYIPLGRHDVLTLHLSHGYESEIYRCLNPYVHY